jgi:hypothetical protein
MTSTSASNKPHGGAAELLVAHELMEHGFGVCIPLGDSEPYDLIAISGKRISRVQVKSSRAATKHGTYRIMFAHGRKTKSMYTSDQTDFIAAVLYYDTTTAIYIIPVKDIKTIKGIFYDVGKHPRYPQKWPTCKWEEYRGRWDLLTSKTR